MATSLRTSRKATENNNVFESVSLTVLELWKKKQDKNTTEFPQGKRVLTVDVLSKGITVDDYIRAKTDIATKNGYDDAFYVMNIDHLISRYKLWMNKLPNIKPFYAVKSNNDPVFLSLLANLGVGFDCASKREIEQILELGVTPDNIVFAHPCKQLSHIRYARDKGVSMMTFDNTDELHKIATEYKDAKLLVRIKCDDPGLTFRLGEKFGATFSESCHLIDIAKELGLNIIGVCFHIGSGMKTPEVYCAAIGMCHSVFEYAASIGYNMTVLDIGGGFSGFKSNLSVFDQSTFAINTSIKKYFSERRDDLMIIAEPGQYFSHSCFSLIVQVTSRRYTNNDLFYYVNDGMFGSLLGWGYYPTEMPLPRSIKCYKELPEMRPCTVWGPTCDVIDKICDTELPLLNVGEWLVFDEIGAYSLSLHSQFNGYMKPNVIYFTSWEE